MPDLPHSPLALNYTSLLGHLVTLVPEASSSTLTELGERPPPRPHCGFGQLGTALCNFPSEM